MFDTEYEDLFWVFTWWACKNYYDWRNHAPDVSRPTENQALDNISQQVYLAEFLRNKLIGANYDKSR